MSDKTFDSIDSSQALQDANVTDIVPAEIRELLGPSPVMDVVEAAIFERLLATAVSELTPVGIIEYQLVYDYVVITWDLRELREYKTSLLRIENARHSTYQDPELIEARRRITEKYNPEFRNKKATEDRPLIKTEHYPREQISPREAFAERFKKPNCRDLSKISSGESEFDRAYRFSEVIKQNAPNMQLLQKMILGFERRCDTVLRDLDRRQASRHQRKAAAVQSRADVTDVDLADAS